MSVENLTHIHTPISRNIRVCPHVAAAARPRCGRDLHENLADMLAHSTNLLSMAAQFCR